jgi:hypothetical protein
MPRVKFIKAMQKHYEFKVEDAWLDAEVNRIVVEVRPYRDTSIKDSYYVPWDTIHKLLSRQKIDWDKTKWNIAYRTRMNKILKWVLKKHQLPYTKYEKVETKRFNRHKINTARKVGIVNLTFMVQIRPTISDEYKIYRKLDDYLRATKVKFKGKFVDAYLGMPEFGRVIENKQNQQNQGGKLIIKGNNGRRSNVFRFKIHISEELIPRHKQVQTFEDFKAKADMQDAMFKVIHDFPLIRSCIGFKEE